MEYSGLSTLTEIRCVGKIHFCSRKTQVSDSTVFNNLKIRIIHVNSHLIHTHQRISLQQILWLKSMTAEQPHSFPSRTGSAIRQCVLNISQST